MMKAIRYLRRLLLLFKIDSLALSKVVVLIEKAFEFPALLQSFQNRKRH